MQHLAFFKNELKTSFNIRYNGVCYGKVSIQSQQWCASALCALTKHSSITGKCIGTKNHQRIIAGDLF